jgi:hypothetical protein
MLLTKAKGTPTRQKLSIGSRFATGITTPNMCFYGFHGKKYTSSISITPYHITK